MEKQINNVTELRHQIDKMYSDVMLKISPDVKLEFLKNEHEKTRARIVELNKELGNDKRKKQYRDKGVRQEKDYLSSECVDNILDKYAYEHEKVLEPYKGTDAEEMARHFIFDGRDGRFHGAGAGKDSHVPMSTVLSNNRLLDNACETNNETVLKYTYATASGAIAAILGNKTYLDTRQKKKYLVEFQKNQIKAYHRSLYGGRGNGLDLREYAEIEARLDGKEINNKDKKPNNNSSRDTVRDRVVSEIQANGSEALDGYMFFSSLRNDQYDKAYAKKMAEMQASQDNSVLNDLINDDHLDSDGITAFER